jgi:c-di-AMP phosphodiesterase-like protein
MLLINIYLSLLLLLFIIVNHVNNLESNRFPNITIPYIFIKKGKITYANTYAIKIIKYLNDLNDNDDIKKFFPDIDLSMNQQEIAIENNLYMALIYNNEDSSGQYIYLVEHNSLVNTNNNVIIGIVMIDNYDEVLSELEETKKPLLAVLVTRKLNEFISSLDGVIERIGHDKYIFILLGNKLDNLKVKNNSVIREIGKIYMGNQTPVSLSFGVSINGNSLIQTMECARTALDLALERGGNQMIIKDRANDSFYFFGDKEKRINSNTRVRARAKGDLISELISESFNVIAMGHKNTDPDSLGACIGVHILCATLGKDCKIIFNQINDSIKLMYDKIKSEIDYKDTFITNKEVSNFFNNKTLVIIVDTHKINLLECPDILKKTDKIIICDHHRRSADSISNTIMDYYEPYASSTCELITEMLQIKGEIKFSSVEADALLAGITVDTKNFSFRTGIKTYEAASYLRRKGADASRVKMFFRSDIENYKVKLKVINNLNIYNNNIAITMCPDDTPSLLVAQIADELLDIKDINASFVLCKTKNQILISARSTGDLNVQIIMEKMGGGGHFTSAATQLSDISMEKAVDILKKSIDES